MDINEIESRAKRVLELIQYDPTIKLDVDSVKLARQFGFTISEKEHLPNSADYTITVDTNQKLIELEKNRARDDKRIAIAYALSQYLLYFKGEPFTSSGVPAHDDAITMAECLLLPKQSFWVYNLALEAVAWDKNTITTKLQWAFNVPPSYVEHRLKMMY